MYFCGDRRLIRLTFNREMAKTKLKEFEANVRKCYTTCIIGKNMRYCVQAGNLQYFYSADI